MLNKLFSIFWMGIVLSGYSHADAPVLTAETEKQYQMVILEEVNAYRHLKGLPELLFSETISKEARQHSQDMADYKMKFEHQDFNLRMAHIKKEVKAFGGGAENIAYFKIPPKQVVQKWLSSSGHKRNIEGHYNLTGIGVAQDKNGWIYYTQIFVQDNAIQPG